MLLRLEDIDSREDKPSTPSMEEALLLFPCTSYNCKQVGLLTSFTLLQRSVYRLYIQTVTLFDLLFSAAVAAAAAAVVVVAADMLLLLFAPSLLFFMSSFNVGRSFEAAEQTKYFPFEEEMYDEGDTPNYFFNIIILFGKI